MPETRKFAQGLKRKNTGPRRLESASQLARGSIYSGVELAKLNVLEPVDYESYIIKRQSEIEQDSLRDLLTFPGSDVEALTEGRCLRTITGTVPTGSFNEASTLLVKESIKSYSDDWHIIYKKFEDYAHDYLALPKTNENVVQSLPHQLFEQEEESNFEEDTILGQKEGVTKRGWLYKAPDYSIASISAKSFKRRYFHLKQMPDSSYILNYYKDEKISKDPKGAIYLDSCSGAHASLKGRKHAFEIEMQDQNCHLLAAETDADAKDWMEKINLALQNTQTAQMLQRERLEQEAKQNGGGGDLGSLKSSMHPELIKYARETDSKNNLERKRDRQNIIKIYPEFQNRFVKPSEPTRRPPTLIPPATLCPSKHRVMVSCKSINFTLRGVVIDGAEEPVTNVEPFFVTLCLYDVSIGKKISADLHVDLNHPLVRRMIPSRSPQHSKRSSGSGSSDESRYGEPHLEHVDSKWMGHPKRGIFTITKPHGEIFLVVRIEKVLQGSIKSCAPPYMRSDGDNHKVAAKVLKHAKIACQRLGQYRMPFAWTAKPLFANDKGHLNINGFDLVYKQEASKLAEEDLLKFLSDFKRPEKLSKLEVIDCDLQVGMDSVPTDLANILTPALIPVQPFEPAASDPVLEVDEFFPGNTEEQHINMEYFNHCYIYPKALNYDSQKTFAKARNIAVVAEFRDSDAEGSNPLCCFHKRPGPPGSGAFTSRVSAAVLHHHEHPEFYEEWKLSLPTQLHHGHHILFSFYHVVVDTSAKKKDSTHTEVGHAWVSLLTKDGRVSTGDHSLPVAASLPAGYLSMQDQVNVGRHNVDVKWVDGGKPLFRARLSLVSSIYTDDQHVHNFFEACQRFHTTQATDVDIIKYLKSLLAADHSILVRFLPTILEQLLFLFAVAGFTLEAQSTCMKTLVHVVATCHKFGHEKLMRQYVKYMFVTAPWVDFKSKTIHEELANAMTGMLRPSAADFLTANKLLEHSWFFLQIITKSMAQHLISTQKFQQSRNERFPISFQHAIQSLVTTTVPHIVQKWQNNITAVHNANMSLAEFIKDCFTYIDRGFVFKLINHYVSNFNPGDVKALFEMKFNFLREVCYHEHYIPLNLPFACSRKSGKSSKSDYSYCLSDEYCSLHFLSGLLLKNVCSALYEVPAVRSIAIETLKNLLAKHVFDNRYQSSSQQSRIASLYLPFLRILLDNVGRLSIEADLPNNKDESHSSRDDLTDSVYQSRGVESFPSTASSYTLPPIGDRAGSLRARLPDSSLMSAIANPGSSLLTRGSRGSLAVNPDTSNGSSPSIQSSKPSEKLDLKDVISISSTIRYQGSEKFDALEIKSLLLCFLHIVDNLPTEALHGFWKDSTTDEQMDFFEVLIMCLHHFRYSGKKHQFQGIRFGYLSKLNSHKARSFPARIRSSTAHMYKNVSILAEPMVPQASQRVGDDELELLSLLEANVSTEAGKIVLDMLAEFTRQYKKQLQSRDGENPLMQKMFDVLLCFLQVPQSEEVLKHAFASLRLVLCKFPNVLFRGTADLCASIIYHALKCCNSSLASTRSEACALLYLLMRNNYQSVPGKNFVRSHLQMIKAVSQLISKEIGIGSSRFQHSLSIIGRYAISDKGMQGSKFPEEVKELTKKIRTVLMATAAMKEHKDDPEMLIDLQCSLAKSYAATPELRRTWLESMARAHQKYGNLSEAAMCHVHIAALVAEYLKRKGGIGRGCAAFRSVSHNVEKEESSLKEDAGMQDIQYNESILVSLLHECADTLKAAERYEVLAAILNMVIPFYEKRRDYEALISVYTILKEGYEKVTEVNRNGKRLLGTYFRVAFYGQTCFEDEDGKQYIYKEPKLTQLSEISQRLQHMYAKKYGQETVRLIQESGKVNRKELDPKLAYIQVTYVQPYFDEQEREQRRTYFEQQHNVRNFVFETPFTPGGRARGDIEEQWKRKTILTTSHCFPYIKKRILVTTMRSFEMKPIEVALDEMTCKCNELEQLIQAERVDLKKLQLRLQGSVNVQVNAGPLAYARSFLREDKIGNHAANTIEMLKQVYRRFVDLCGRALYINEQLITSNQQEYHESLQYCYNTMTAELSQILREQLVHDDEDSISVSTATGYEIEQQFVGTPKRVAGSVSDSSAA